MYFYDFEVFKHDWLVVIKDTIKRERHVVHNDNNALKELLKDNPISIGYNSNHYDKIIIQGVCHGMTPRQLFDLSNDVINTDTSEYQLLKKYKIKPVPFINYDTMGVDFKSLKQLEGALGDDITECSVPWSIDRPLTDAELETVIHYCECDVDATIKVFMHTSSVFSAKLGLLTEFKLPLTYLSKSMAQLSAIILGAVRTSYNDEFDITIVDTVRLSKYRELIEWYESKPNYGEQFIMDIAGVKHVFGWGGAHGAIPNYNEKGFFVMSDIASQHPAEMIEYNFLSRSVKDKSKFKTIRDNRIILKAAHNKKQESLKLLLNATNGATKDPYNPLYDPVMNNNVCVTAQLVIVDLIEHVEDICEIIQTNTDGILVKLDPKNYDEYLKRCHEWEQRIRLDLEHDEYKHVIQKDVNNYIIIPDGPLYKGDKPRFKSKGAYVKQLSALDNNLEIVNKAIIDYFTKGVEVEETINNCRELKKFQMIIKASGKYDGVYHGKNIDGKVHRIFASNDMSDQGIFRLKNGKLHKIENSPLQCFIKNTSVINARMPRRLDRQWYIDIAHKRISHFLGVDNHKQLKLF